MSKAIRVQDGNLVIDIDTGVANVATDPSTLNLDASINIGGFGIVAELGTGTGGFEVDTWLAADKSYVGVYNDETGQYTEITAHGSTFGGGTNSTLYTSTNVSPFDIFGDYRVMMRFDSTSLANTFVDITDGTRLRIWDDTEVDNVEISHDGTNLVFTPTTTSALAIEGLYFDMLEIADPAFGVDIGRGRLWVQNTTPNQLMFTDDAGNDVVAASSTGTVTATGSPLNNEIAVFTDGTTIDSDATFTWDGTTLSATAITVDNISIDLNTISTTSGALNLTPFAGSAIVLDGTISVDAGVVTGATSITSTGVTVSSLTDNRVVIAGTGGVLEGDANFTWTGTTLAIAGAGVQLLLPLENDAATPTLAFGDGDSGIYQNQDNRLAVAVGGGIVAQFISGDVISAGLAAGPVLRNQTPTSTVATVCPSANDNNTGLGWAAADQLSLITGAVEASRLTAATVQTTTVATTPIISVAVPSGESFGFEIHCMGTEPATGDTVFERVFGAITNLAGVVTLVGSTIVDRTDDAGAATWVITVAANDGTDALTVDVAGEAAHTIDWKVRVEILNV